MSLKKIAVLVSGRGSNLQAIIDEIDNGSIRGQISLVIASKDAAYALERAKAKDIKTVVVSKKLYEDIEKRTNIILKELDDSGIDFVVLAGYMEILQKRLIDKYENKIINIHPSLIPSFCGKGLYGMKVHNEVYNYGVKITGATVHFVDEGADTGPVIMQDSIRISDTDKPEDIASKVLQIEHILLPKVIGLMCLDKIIVDGRRVIILD